MTTAWLERAGLQARPLRALVFAYVLQDLRSQHFARATGVKPGELLPPLFWVVGQHVIASGLAATALFMRVDPYSVGFILAAIGGSAIAGVIGLEGIVRFLLVVGCGIGGGLLAEQIVKQIRRP